MIRQRLRPEAKPATPALLVLILSILLAGCAGFGGPGATRGAAERVPPEGETAGLTERQRDIVEAAHMYRGAEKLRVRGRDFRMDCTGAVAALYWHAGIDLLAPLAEYRGNGVTRLYRFMEDKGLTASSDDPAPGDIIFWDNTYDRNEDGRANDLLTHTGVIVSTEADGTVVYFHHNYRHGLVFERMNIRDPDTHMKVVKGEKVLMNSPMRMRGSPNFELWLAAQLLRSYGRAWKLGE